MTSLGRKSRIKINNQIWHFTDTVIVLLNKDY